MDCPIDIEVAKMQTRSFDRWGKFAREEFSLKEFLLLKGLPKEEKIYSIVIDGKYIDIHLRIKDKAPIVFFFHGAIQRSKGVIAPVFAGFNAVTENLSRVLFSDASLLESNELGLAWHSGNKNVDLQEIIPQIINKIIVLSNSKRQIFAGGSGGGFAALYYSSFFSQSVAVVSNSQTDIRKYNVYHVKRYASIAFDTTPDELNKFINVDLKEVYNKDFKNYIFYMQNLHDKMHVNKHCIPFLQGIDESFSVREEGALLGGKLYFIYPDWGVGHIGPNRNFWSSVIEKIAFYSGDIERLFSSKDFSSFIKNRRSDYKYSVLEKAKDSLFKNELALSNELVKHYFRLSGKHEASAFTLAIRVNYLLGNWSDIDDYYNEAAGLYPKGWVIKYKYALYISENNRKDEALVYMKELAHDRGVRAPKSLLDKIKCLEKLGSKC